MSQTTDTLFVVTVLLCIKQTPIKKKNVKNIFSATPSCKMEGNIVVYLKTLAHAVV